MVTTKWRILAGTALLLLVVTVGCSTNPLPLEGSFSLIAVDQSDSTQVLNLLPEKGMLHTASAVSVYRDAWGTREVAIVQFAPADSSVQRKQYMQVKSHLAPVPLFLDQRFLFQLQTSIPQEILDEPYENDMRKYVAILQHTHEMMIQDLKPFTEDQATESLMGMARGALGVAIHELTIRPREYQDLVIPPGFAFTHGNLGKCRLFVSQEEANIFSLNLNGGEWVDMFNAW